jgi:hypothetical protein
MIDFNRKLFIGIVLVALLLQPARDAHAIGGDIVTDWITEFQTSLSASIENIGKPIGQMLKRAFIAQIRNSLVKWIQGGFQGQPFIPADYEQWAKNTGDKAGGLFLDKLTNGGFSQFCTNPSFNIGLSLPQSEPFEIKTKCSLSEFGNNWQKAYDSAAKGDWSAWLQISRPENNPYGQMLLSWEEQNRIKTAATTKEQTDLSLNKGVLSLRVQTGEADPVCVQNCEDSSPCKNTTGWTTDANTEYCDACKNDCKAAGSFKTTTPGAVINDQLSNALGSGWRDLEAAQDIQAVFTALANYAMDRVMTAVIPRGGSGSSSSAPQYSSIGAYAADNPQYKKYETWTAERFRTEFNAMKERLYKYKIIKDDSNFSSSSEGYTDAFGLPIDKSRIGGFRISAGGYDWPELNFLKELTGIAEPPKEWAGTHNANLTVLRGGLMHTMDDAQNGTYLMSLMRVSWPKETFSLECNLGSFGGRKDNDEALNAIKSGLAELNRKIADIQKFFNANGEYDSYLTVIDTAEKTLADFASTTIDASLQKEAGDTFLTDVQMLEKIKSQVPDHRMALAERTATYTTFDGSNPYPLKGDGQMHCWVKASDTVLHPNRFVPHYAEITGLAYGPGNDTDAAERACMAKYDKLYANGDFSQYSSLNGFTPNLTLAAMPTADLPAMLGLTYYSGSSNGPEGGACDTQAELAAKVTQVVSACGNKLGTVSVKIKRWIKNPAYHPGTEGSSDVAKTICADNQPKNFLCGPYLQASCQYLKLSNDEWYAKAMTTKAEYDEYGDWSAPENLDNPKDTCNGDTANPYTCAPNDSFAKCKDVASNIEASATGGTGGSGGSQNQGGTAGDGGSASVSAKYSVREVTCVAGEGIDPNLTASTTPATHGGGG